MQNINIKTNSVEPIVEFFSLRDFFVEELTANMIKVNRSDEEPIIIAYNNDRIYFEMDLGALSGDENHELFFQLLDINTEILPVSVGINSVGAGKPRLVLVESRKVSDLSESELLEVISALEIAEDRIVKLLGGQQ